MTTRELIHQLMECNLDAPVNFDLLKDWKSFNKIRVYNHKNKETYIEIDRSGFDCFEILEVENKLLVIIKSTKETSAYWSELLETVFNSGHDDEDIYFNFLYRNGLHNQWFVAHTDNDYPNSVGLNNKWLSNLKIYKNEDKMLDEAVKKYFSDNYYLLEGSVLTKEQRKMFKKC